MRCFTKNCGRERAAPWIYCDLCFSRLRQGCRACSGCGLYGQVASRKLAWETEPHDCAICKSYYAPSAPVLYTQADMDAAQNRGYFKSRRSSEKLRSHIRDTAYNEGYAAGKALGEGTYTQAGMDRAIAEARINKACSTDPWYQRDLDAAEERGYKRGQLAGSDDFNRGWYAGYKDKRNEPGDPIPTQKITIAVDNCEIFDGRVLKES